jgi:hypothetical protein
MHPSALNCGSPCSAQPVAPEAVSEPSRFARLFSFCLPKVADLFGQNYQEAKTANQDSHLMMFEQSPFNAMIDSAIKKLKDSQETNQSIWEFIEESSYYKDFDGKEVRFSSQVDARLNGLGCGTFFTRIDGTEMSKEEIKALLLASKFRAQRRPLAVTRLINVADSLHVTAQKQAGLTSVQLLSESDLLHLSGKLGDAKSKSTIDSTTHKQLQNLFDRLIQITPDTSKEDLERLFNTYLWMTPLFESSEEFNHLRRAEREEIDAPFDRFYQDLKKPDSTFLTLLDGEIQKKRISANQAKKEVQFLERQERSLGYLKFKKWTDPTEGLVFFDLFHMINNLTFQKPIIARAVKWMNSSVKDQSLSSFWATMGITSLVASYVLYKVAQFFLSLAIAAVCYIVGSTAWGLATLFRDLLGEGAHWFVDWLKRGEIKDLSKKNRSAIANDDRGTVIQNQLQSHLLNCAGVLGLEIAQQLNRPLRGRDVVNFKLAVSGP